MDILVINLSTATDRMAVMEAQLARLGLTCTRIEAVTAAKAAGTRTPSYWDSWERPLMETERACLLSHITAWQTVADNGRPALILEDDAVLSNRVPELLAALKQTRDIEHLTLEVRKRRKLLGKASRSILPGLELRRLYQDRSGAAAYVLWPGGAQKLLQDTETCAGLADAVICRAYGMRSYQAEPACAVQMDRCAAYGLVPPIAPKSSIDAGVGTKDKGGAAFRLRRVAGQMRMARRAISAIGRAERRDVRLQPADFENKA